MPCIIVTLDAPEHLRGGLEEPHRRDRSIRLALLEIVAAELAHDVRDVGEAGYRGAAIAASVSR